MTGTLSATTWRPITSAMDDTSAFHLPVATTVSLVIVPTSGEFTRVRLIAVSLLIGSTIAAVVAAMIRTRAGVVALATATAQTLLQLTSARVALRT